MDTIQHFKAKPALHPERCKMDDEDELNWLTEAELLTRLAENARRLEIIERLQNLR